MSGTPKKQGKTWSGSEGDVEWEISEWYVKGTDQSEFDLTVRRGNLIRKTTYPTTHPTRFGLDVADHAAINQLLDHLMQAVAVEDESDPLQAPVRGVETGEEG